MKSLDVDRALDPVAQHIVLTGIPMPISTNGAYSTAKNYNETHKTKRVLSKKANAYKKNFGAWAFRNMEAIKDARKMIRKWNVPLKASLYFVFSKNKLLDKDNLLKRNDVANREKIVMDILCEHLRIDDSSFISLELEKLVSASSSEQLIVVIKPTKMRSILDIYSESEDSSLV